VILRTLHPRYAHGGGANRFGNGLAAKASTEALAYAVGIDLQAGPGPWGLGSGPGGNVRTRRDTCTGTCWTGCPGFGCLQPGGAGTGLGPGLAHLEHLCRSM